MAATFFFFFAGRLILLGFLRADGVFLTGGGSRFGRPVIADWAAAMSEKADFSAAAAFGTAGDERIWMTMRLPRLRLLTDDGLIIEAALLLSATELLLETAALLFIAIEAGDSEPMFAIEAGRPRVDSPLRFLVSSLWKKCVIKVHDTCTKI